MEHRFDNETLETIFQRHSVRQFQDTEVGEDLIQVILEAANSAPSAHNQQAWRFVVVRGAAKEALAKLVTTRSQEFPKPSSSILRMAARTIASAPVVVAVMNTGGLIEHGTRIFRINETHSQDFFRTMEIQSSAAAVQNLLLAATSLGLGTVWLGILYLIKEDVLPLLGEKQGEFMAVVPLGYPKKEHSGPSKKGLEELVKYLD
ncbi:MAG: nitroreductase family protein [Desulfovibrionales bacterium]